MKLTIAKVDETLFDGEAHCVHLPGVDGEFGVLSHHEPLIATLKAGVISVRKEKEAEPQRFTIEKGVLEVSRNEVIVLL